MNNGYRPLIAALLSCTILTLSHAKPTFSMPLKPFGAYQQNPTIEQIVKDYRQGIMNNSSSRNVLSKLNSLEQQRADLIHSLKSKLTSDAKISSLIATNRDAQTANLLSQKHDENNAVQMNFLAVQIDEAAQLISAVPESIKASLKILKEMREITTQAASGTYSSTEMIILDREYQSIKQRLSYVQHIGLKDGEKSVSSGNIIILFGKEKNDASTYVIPVQAFDVDSLGLRETDINDTLKASSIIWLLDQAINRLTIISATINDDVIIDALVILESIPYILYQDYQIFDIAHALIMRSCNETYSDSDQKIMDGYFDQIKLTLNKLQTYSSLRGIKMLGTGNVHIQIGAQAKPESTLVIKLPITDIKKTGMDNQHLYVPPTSNESWSLSDSYKAAHKALDNIVAIEHDFIYGK